MSQVQQNGHPMQNDSINEVNSPGFDERFQEIFKEVFDTVSPVWPLKDYVAVNPYFGINHRRFADARAYLKVFSDCELLMPLSHYAEQFRQERFDRTDISTAIQESEEVGIRVDLSLEEIVERLTAEQAQPTLLDVPAAEPNLDRRIRTMAEAASDASGTNWTEAICDEVSKFCAGHYDDGQASWRSPWRHLPLFKAWVAMATHDRSLESLGLRGLRTYVATLPSSADAAIVYSLEQLHVPLPLWSTFLLCQAFAIPGWSAWTKYQDTELDETSGDHFAGLLAMKLAYEVVLAKTFNIQNDWNEFVHQGAACFPTSKAGDDTSLRCVLLRANEIGFRKNLVSSLGSATHEATPPTRKLAQMVFCIDVRSERIRRRLESTNSDIETLGFAGFFAMPIAFRSIGEPEAVPQLPVLLKPQFSVHEGLQQVADANGAESQARESGVLRKRSAERSWLRLWRGFQTSAVGCFSFVETTGVFFGYKLLRRALGWPTANPARSDGSQREHVTNMRPTLRGLEEQGISLERQVALVQGMLTNLGLLDNFAKLIVLCGHASQTDNNPLAAGLDCGACGGHSGEPNARFAATLLNRPEIRHELAERGIVIPEDTHFLGAVHNTTTDAIQFFELQELPSNLNAEFNELKTSLAAASEATQCERLPVVASNSIADLLRRASDWSELRPEWGLAGNAAFIVAPRSMTKQANLDARSFLHSYDHTLDPEGSVLETIMTAPMVVANWINMQYYASTVDNHHFGSGNKTVHNVVGRFGILSGNGGDLMTGLPWQSLHTGKQLQHLPLRLQVVIAAPRPSISRVIERHELVANLITNGWLHLVAIEDEGVYRYTAHGTWEVI